MTALLLPFRTAALVQGEKPPARPLHMATSFKRT